MTCCASSPCGSFIVSASYDRTACVMSVDQPGAVATLAAHDNVVYTVGASSAGTVVTGSFDRSVILWALPRERADGLQSPAICVSPGTGISPGGCGTPRTPGSRARLIDCVRMDAEVISVAISRDGLHVVAATTDGVCRVFSVSDPAYEPVAVTPKSVFSHQESMKSLIDPLLASALESAGVLTSDRPRSGEPEMPGSLHCVGDLKEVSGKPVGFLRFSPCGTILLVGAFDGTTVTYGLGKDGHWNCLSSPSAPKGVRMVPDGAIMPSAMPGVTGGVYSPHNSGSRMDPGHDLTHTQNSVPSRSELTCVDLGSDSTGVYAKGSLQGVVLVVSILDGSVQYRSACFTDEVLDVSVSLKDEPIRGGVDGPLLLLAGSADRTAVVTVLKRESVKQSSLTKRTPSVLGACRALSVLGASRRTLGEYGAKLSPISSRRLVGHLGPVTKVLAVKSAHMPLVVTCGGDGRCIFWHAETCVKQFVLHVDASINFVAIAHGDCLAVSDASNTIRVYTGLPVLQQNTGASPGTHDVPSRGMTASMRMPTSMGRAPTLDSQFKLPARDVVKSSAKKSSPNSSGVHNRPTLPSVFGS